MKKLLGYTVLDTIHRGSDTVVYRARADERGTSHVLKVTLPPFPSHENIARLRNEYEILGRLDSSSVIQAQALLQHQGRWVLVFEDVDAQSLHKLDLAGQLPLGEFLDLASKIARALADIHRQGVTHRDINPSNIVKVADTRQVKLIDFELSTWLSQEEAGFAAAQGLVGTLPYISPEQTGRMNRQVDYRTDYYSLGVTLYELLTGRLPFSSTDPLELVHGHIARPPVPPEQLGANPTVSRIIGKLMSKRAEDRYQSGHGLVADLERCATEWRESGQIAPFTPGMRDITGRFSAPAKLYGRANDVAILRRSFEQIASGGLQAIFLTGPSGIGKTALAQELFPAITARQGYFVSGKFDQFQGDVLGSALMSAFSDLTRMLLCESDEQLHTWRQRFADALGLNAKVMCNLVPGLEFITGPQPDPAALGPVEAQTRFELLFLKFIRALGHPDHPLVLFIDDLQWANARSIRLIDLMLRDHRIDHVLFIGAYRDDEIDLHHPLSLMLRALPAERRTQLALTPLGSSDIASMVEDTFPSAQPAQQLAELIQAKTGGNSFSVQEFLRLLHRDGLVAFDAAQRAWTWNIEEVHGRDISDNVVDVLIECMETLPDDTRRALKLAACMGNRFSVELLAVVAQRTRAELVQDLERALRERLVTAMQSHKSGEFRFSHDRVQQSAYELVPDTERRHVHLKIGRFLRRHLKRQEADDAQVDTISVVNHLNQAEALIESPDERLAIARLNLTAGRQAHASTAYHEARHFLATGIEFLPDDALANHYELALELHQQFAAVLLLEGEYDACEQYIEWLLSIVTARMDRAALYNRLVVQYTGQARYADAIVAGRAALSLLDIQLPVHPPRTAVEAELASVKELIAGLSVPSLAEAPAMQDPEKMMAVQILINLDSACYLSDIDLYCVVVATVVALSVDHGPVPESAKGYASYGIVLCAFDEFELGHAFAALGVQIARRFDHLGQLCRACHTMANHVQYWSHHIADGDPFNDDGYTAGFEAGEYLWCGYIRHFKPMNQFFRGRELQALLPDIDMGLEFCADPPNQISIDTLLGLQLAIRALLPDDPPDGSPEELPEESPDDAYVRQCKANKSLFALCNYLTSKGQILYLLGDYPAALKALEEAIPLRPFIFSTIAVAAHNFYHSLALLARAHQRADDQRQRAIEQVEHNQKRMRAWANSCPANFQHLWCLVEAEREFLEGRHMIAIRRYDEASASAAQRQFPHIEALAHERQGLLWQQLDKPDVAELYLHKAARLYGIWGAWRKVEALLQTHDLEVAPTPAASPISSKYPGSTGTGSFHLDLHSVVKACNSIAQEILLPRLASALMDVVMENAGAERAAFLISADNGLHVVADVVADGELDREPNPEIATEIARPSRFHEPGSLPLSAWSNGPHSVINYVYRSGDIVVLDDALAEREHATDPYIRTNGVRSLLCLPVIKQGHPIALVYLENRLATGTFTRDRVELLQLLSGQIAISLENARLYTQLAQALQDARSAERLKHNFMATVSHELRTPLNAIINMPRILVETLPPELADAQDRVELLELIEDSGHQLLRVIDAIIDYNRLEAGVMPIESADVSLAAIATDVIADYQTEASDKGVTVRPHFDERDALVKGDRRMLGKIVGHLLANAVKFSPAGGDIEIDVVRSPGARSPGPREHGDEHGDEHGGEVILRVRDHGVGIAHDAQAFIFEGFRQASEGSHRSHGGTGLGLAVTRRMVELHGGRISLHSQPGEGATFEVRLPCC